VRPIAWDASSAKDQTV